MRKEEGIMSNTANNIIMYIEKTKKIKRKWGKNDTI